MTCELGLIKAVKKKSKDGGKKEDRNYERKTIS